MPKWMARLLFAVAVLLYAVTGIFLAKAIAEPEESTMEKYLTPALPVVEQLADAATGESLYKYDDECAQDGFSDGGVRRPYFDFDAIIAMGEKLWKLIDAGRPVVRVKTAAAHAIPKGIACWMDLETWQPPKSALYQVAYKNLLGIEVARFRFRLVYTFGGSLDGHGKYLANVTVVPADVSVSWGYQLESEASIGRVINLGTRKDPEAGMELMINWNIKTPLKEALATETFFVRGNGQLSLVK